MITYQTESWDQYWRDAEPLWEQHWQEIALDKDSIKLDPDKEAYAKLYDMGKLLLVTAREEGVLVGYHASFIMTHLHYKSTLTGHGDVFWLHPDHRKGSAGLKLFHKVEAEMRSRGVKKMSMSHKLHLDLGALFRYLGYTHIENTYAKML